MRARINAYRQEYPLCGKYAIVALWRRNNDTYCRYMLLKGVRLDTSVIYDYVEEMCSAVILSLHLHPDGDSPPLHNTLLLRQWLTNPYKLLGNKETTSIHALLDCMQYLMDRVRSGKADSMSRFASIYNRSDAAFRMVYPTSKQGPTHQYHCGEIVSRQIDLSVVRNELLVRCRLLCIGMYATDSRSLCLILRSRIQCP